MNVQKLIAHLQQFDPNMPVHFAYNYGDHWRTIVAPEIKSVDELRITFSQYHEENRLVEDEEEDEPDENDQDEDIKTAIVLR